MKAFYRGLCVVCAVCAATCIPFRPLWFGLAFFTALSVCAGAMWALLTVRDQQDNRWSRAAGRVACIGHIVFLLWLLSVAVVEGLILSGAHTDAQAMTADTIFVLGGGIKGEQPTQTLRNRLAVALDGMEQNPNAQIIVCGGQGDDEICTEASVMRRWMVNHGADSARITVEDQSRNTVQNIENALQICRKKGWSTDQIGVLSSGFHLFRVRHIMRNCALSPAAIAAPSGNPAMHVLFCIREYFSIWKLIFTGYW